jgi:osmotically-inducible protein OsmY
MGMRDFFKGDRDHDNDRWREQWRDDRYPQRYSSGSNVDRDRGSFSRGQRGPQFYGQSGRADWADQRDAGRTQGSRERDQDEWRGDRDAGNWNQNRREDRDAPYHGGFYAGETGRESTYRTEPSGQGDWGRDSQRWSESRNERSWDQQPRDRDDWRPFESQSPFQGQQVQRQQFQGEHRGRGPKGYQRSDQRIHEEVCECLTDDSFIDASNIEINVQSGVVTLTGTVSSRQEKRRAEDLIENLSGVKDVNNSLRVGEDTGRTGLTAQSSPGQPAQARPQASDQQTPRH